MQFLTNIASTILDFVDDLRPYYLQSFVISAIIFCAVFAAVFAVYWLFGIWASLNAALRIFILLLFFSLLWRELNKNPIPPQGPFY